MFLGLVAMSAMLASCSQQPRQLHTHQPAQVPVLSSARAHWVAQAAVAWLCGMFKGALQRRPSVPGTHTGRHGSTHKGVCMSVLTVGCAG